MNVSINQLVSATPQTIVPQTVLMQHMVFFLLKAHYVVFGKKFYSEEKKSLLTDFFSFFFALNKYIPASFS